MELRTLGRTSWDKIKVGEVFGEEGCFNIYYKATPTRSILLDSTAEDYAEIRRGKLLGSHWGYLTLYKLPIAVQRLWKTE